MGWDEVPVVLPVSAVSMDCPLGAPIGNLPTFVAHTENATDYVFYLDDDIQNTSANTFTPDSNIT